MLPAMPRRLQAASDGSPSATSFYAIDGLRLCRLGKAVAFQSTLGPEMARPIPVVLYVASMVAVIGTDLLFFRNRIWEQLMEKHRHHAGVRLPVFRNPSANMILGHAWRLNPLLCREPASTCGFFAASPEKFSPTRFHVAIVIKL